MATKFASNMDKNAIEVAIKSIAQRGAALDKDIQLTALSVIAHIDVHNEPSLFVKLYNALPKGSRSNALIAWAVAFSKVEVNLDKNTKKEKPFLCDKGKKTDLQGATLKPWFDFKKPADPADEFSLDAAYRKFMDMVEAKIKNGKVNPDSELARSLKASAQLIHIPDVTVSTGTEPVTA